MKTRKQDEDLDALIGCGIILAFALALVFAGVAIWAVVRLVLHFT